MLKLENKVLWLLFGKKKFFAIEHFMMQRMISLKCFGLKTKYISIVIPMTNDL